MRPDQVEKLCMSCMTLKPDRAASCPGCGADLNVKNEQNQLPVGTVLAGKYLIGRTLGQGGFGITYIGMDLNLDLPVAIKEFFPGDLVTREQTMGATVMPFTRRGAALFPAGRDKFAEEARNLVRFDSLPGIVRARDLFYANNTAYIVMDYIDGKTLKRLMAEKGGKLDAAWLMEGLRPLIGSLEIIHATNLLHRDISPDNIMLDKDGSLKLLDFGSARQFSAEGEHSNTINVKHGYAPPEQYQTRGRQGAWTDIYSLCATIYKLTTGATPPQSLDRLTQDELLTPSALGARMTPRQEAAIMKGLSLRIEDRFQSVAELSAALYGQGKAAPSAGAQNKNAGAQYEQRRAAETAAKQKQQHEAEKAEHKGINKAAVITICVIAALLLIAGVASLMRMNAGSAQMQEAAGSVQTQEDSSVEEQNDMNTVDEPHIQIEAAPPEDFNFRKNDTGIVILGYESDAVELRIPDFIAGEPVTQLGNDSFAFCESLWYVIIPDSVTDIREHVFYGCINLSSVEIPDSVGWIGEMAFYDCLNLEEIDIPEGVREIQNGTFGGCMNLRKVTIPNSVVDIAENAFDRCRDFTIYTLKNSYAQRFAEAHGIPYQTY